MLIGPEYCKYKGMEHSFKQLYIRTFAYTDAEYRNTIGCIEHIKSNKIILMMKETPHDFFLTHPNDRYAGTINRPTIMEFDTGNEFNGQGIIANTWHDDATTAREYHKKITVTGWKEYGNVVFNNN